MEFGRIGIWQGLRAGNPGVVAEIERLGYGAFWLGGSPSVEQARPYVEAASRIPVGTSILNVWQHDPADVAREHLKLTADHPDRFLLGIGIGHPEGVGDYSKPLTKMRTFLDGLDAGGVPKQQRAIAALGPKMLDLAGERTLGTLPYFVEASHTRSAREQLGPDPLLAVEVAVVVDPEPERARAVARTYAKMYLGLSNYTRNLLRFDWTEADLADGGSDALIDAVVPHGSPEAIAEAVQAHFDAGADHVCLQPLDHGADLSEDLEALAAVLI